MPTVRDLTSENSTSQKTNKKQSKAKGKRNKIQNVGTTGIDDDFELSTKSKAHKKIKIDPRKAFGGDIMKPRYCL